MNGGNRCRRHPEIEHARLEMLYEHQVSEVTITSNKKPAVGVCDVEKLRVERFRHRQVGRCHDIMSVIAQEANRRGVDILIYQESHALAVRWMSSRLTMSI